MVKKNNASKSRKKVAPLEGSGKPAVKPAVKPPIKPLVEPPTKKVPDAKDVPKKNTDTYVVAPVDTGRQGALGSGG